MYEVLKTFNADGQLYIEVYDKRKKLELLYEATAIKKIQDKELQLFLRAQMYWIKQGVFHKACELE